MIYKFHLREGVKWHDGAMLKVDDVIATFERIVNPPDNIAIGIQSLFTEIDSIEDAGDNWVQFNLKRPSAHQFNAFTMLNATILPKKCLEELDRMVNFRSKSRVLNFYEDQEKAKKHFKLIVYYTIYYNIDLKYYIYFQI